MIGSMVSMILSLVREARNPMNTKILFLDFEASGLHARSFPIEVGWAIPNGPSKSYLICHEPWLAQDELWDDYAERHIHHISRDMLRQFGKSPWEVVQSLEADGLRDYAVCADSVTWDQRWLYFLYDAAGVPNNTFQLCDSDSMINLVIECHGSQDHAMKARQLAGRMCPPNHRAEQDARHYAMIVELIMMKPDEFTRMNHLENHKL